jgi:hypothetical protein
LRGSESEGVVRDEMSRILGGGGAGGKSSIGKKLGMLLTAKSSVFLI